jgi:hypothetical protein
MVQMGEGFIKLSSIPRGGENPTFISTRGKVVSNIKKVLPLIPLGTPRVERIPQAPEDNAPSN